ncbi:MAG: hypothetical protein ACK4ZS_06150 [Sulfurimicrobium sp.]
MQPQGKGLIEFGGQLIGAQRQLLAVLPQQARARHLPEPQRRDHGKAQGQGDDQPADGAGQAAARVQIAQKALHSVA